MLFTEGIGNFKPLRKKHFFLLFATRVKMKKKKYLNKKNRLN